MLWNTLRKLNDFYICIISLIICQGLFLGWKNIQSNKAIYTITILVIEIKFFSAIPSRQKCMVDWHSKDSFIFRLIYFYSFLWKLLRRRNLRVGKNVGWKNSTRRLKKAFILSCRQNYFFILTIFRQMKILNPSK